MTAEELAKIPLRYLSHLSMAHEHCTVYANDDYNIRVCLHTAVKRDGTFGRTYTHYSHNGIVYKTKAKFLEAIKDLQL